MSIPGYWQNETGDVLRPAVAAYLRGDELDDDQAAAIRAYLRQWMDGPWRLDPVVWLSLIGGIGAVRDRESLHEWLRDALEVGIDPL